MLDWNEPSIRFYESLGAQRLPEWQLVRMMPPEFMRLAATLERAVTPRSTVK